MQLLYVRMMNLTQDFQEAYRRIGFWSIWKVCFSYSSPPPPSPCGSFFYFDHFFQELCLSNVNRLCAGKMATMDDDTNLHAMPLARAMAQFCISLDTALLFQPLVQQHTSDFVCACFALMSLDFFCPVSLPMPPFIFFFPPLFCRARVAGEHLQSDRI